MTLLLFSAEDCTDVNEVRNSCGSACPKTCANMKMTGIACIEMCVDGCFCKPGFVRNAQGKCVLTKDCPPVPYEGECSDPNETYKMCGTACPITCKNFNHPPQACIMVCKQGCFCNAPYVRDESSGKCVLSSDCPAATTVAA